MQLLESQGASSSRSLSLFPAPVASRSLLAPTDPHFSFPSLLLLLTDEALESLIRSATSLRSLVAELAAAPLPPSASSAASDDDDDEEDPDGGEREIVELARTAAELMDEPVRD